MASFSSLRVRLLLLVLLAILPALGLILYTGWEQRRYAASNAYENALRLVRLASSDEAELIRDGHDLLAGLAQLPAVRRRNSGACNAIFARLLIQYPRYSNIGATDAEGNVFCSAVPPNRPLNIGARTGFRRTLQARAFTVGAYQIGRITGRAMLPLNYPILDAAGQVQVVIYAALDLAWLNRFAANAELPPSSTLTVVDRNGTILVRHPTSERWVGKPMPNTPLIQAMLGQRTTGMTEAAGVDGIPRLYAFTPLRGATGVADAYLSIGIPTQVAFAEIDKLLTQNLAGLGVAAVLALIAAWVGSNVFVLRQVKGLVCATSRLAAGDLRTRTGMPYGSGELGQLAHAFDEMAGALEQREADRTRAEEERERSLRQLRALSARLQAVREEERIQIAREVHDELGQALTGLKMDLSWLARRLPQDQQPLLQRAHSMLGLVDSTIHTVREISTRLRPGVLDHLGLAAAIEWQVQDFEARTGIRCRFTSGLEEIPLDRDRSTAMFRILQETLTNVTRHAGATSVAIRLEEIAGSAILEVQDNGRGITESEVSDRKSLGLLGIRERTLVLGGGVQISGIQGKGTTVRVRIPIGESTEGDRGP